jgi:hypothetical protein
MIPAALITRATLDSVAQTYETDVLPDDPNAGVLWDAMQVSCGDTLGPPVNEVVPGSVLHYWLVLDAIQSAESVTQGAEGRAAIETARAWLADPCARTRRAAADAARSATYGSAYAAAYATTYEVDTTSADYVIDSAPADDMVYAAVAAYAAYATTPYDEAAKTQLRLRVLATMATAGVLPAPEVAPPRWGALPIGAQGMSQR